MYSEYEKLREDNIRRNKELLLALSLDKPLIAPPAISARKRHADSRPTKRKAPKSTDDDKASVKVARLSAEVSHGFTTDGARRSSRNMGKARVSYTDEVVGQGAEPLARRPKGIGNSDNRGGLDVSIEGKAENVGNRLGRRTQDP